MNGLRLLPLFALCSLAPSVQAQAPEHPLLTWVKRHPLAEKKGKPSPKLGYECAYAYDPRTKLLIRYAGHNQGNGGEQNSEVWTYDLDKDLWTLREPNTSPPGVCCGQQNVFHDPLGLYVRFPSFSASHGWQSLREVRLRDSSVWTYDLEKNNWLDMRPLPEPAVRPLRGAAYDPFHEVIVLHGGETAKHGTLVYDLFSNTWHERKPDPAPAANLSQPGFTFDPFHRKFVLFGSQFASDPRTWIYDLPKNEWQTLEVDQRPPFDKSSPIMAADRSGNVLASVKGEKELETWALDIKGKTWKKLDVKWSHEREETTNGNRNRTLVYLPDRNLFMQEIRTKSEQQIWTMRLVEAPPLPETVTEVRLDLSDDGNAVEVAWAAPSPGGSFNVYRAGGERSWELDWALVGKAVKETRFLDKGLKPRATTWYRVHVIEKGKEGLTGPLARTKPPVVRDLAVSALNPKQVELSWQAPAKEDIVGYHVERAEVMVFSTDEVKGIKDRYEPTSDLAVGHLRKIGKFERLTRDPIKELRFLDGKVDLSQGPVKEIKEPLWDRELRGEQVVAGKPYKYAVFAYRVVAVNPLGVESGPSPARFSFPEAVEQVFAREEGKTGASLKWAKHRGAQGYLVYRHNGRFSASKIVRVTAELLKETGFQDEGPGTAARRYEVVAVDALGQEGMPSSPVWSRREWGSFYVPYTGEWHQ